MNKRDFSFSSDTGNISRKDLDETSKIAEDYFGTQKNNNQIATTPENRDWFYKNIKDCINIIRFKEKIIGFSFTMPTTKKLMNSFISGKINERELFEKIKQEKIQQFPEAIYLCSAVIKKEFRRKGLVKEAFLKSLNKIISNSNKRPILFYESYSAEGNSLAKKIADLIGLTLKSRKE